MIALVCESSTLLGSVAIFKDSALLAYKESLRQGSHSDVLNNFIEHVLQESKLKLTDIDVFVTGIGPGSFTGIRISLNTIKTLAYCHSKPVLAINSLENLAWQSSESVKPVVSMINAYKNMVYIATYHKENGELITLKPPEVVRVQNLNNYITQPVTVVGDGYTTYSKFFDPKLLQLIHRESDPIDDPKALAAKHFIYDTPTKPQHWSTLVPLYLRASEAEENLKGIRFQPLA